MKYTYRRLSATLFALGLLGASPAVAGTITPAQLAANAATSQITVGTNTNENPRWRSVVDGDRVVEMWATSPAMDNRSIPVVVIKASQPARPTLYLLNGGDGGEGRANWLMQTDAIDFYKEKDINVVIPMAGRFSYYSDWVQDVPHLGGKQRWETFLTKELPGPIENLLGANGKRAIAGMSMSATSALLLAEHNPGFYDAVGAFSGCYASSKPAPTGFIALTLQRGQATIEQMWGPWGNPTWIYNDAVINAEGLRNSEVYVSNGSGLAGAWDMPTGPRLIGQDPLIQSVGAATTIIEGGVIEAATNACTHDLKSKMDSLNIPADFNFRPTGTHSWGYWQDDLRNSWVTFERAFNS
ncbi:esterase family protein [Corynebacterium sp. ES2794-CONJ1]|uniref:alpha/beta hydrolase n=1 Tax=unclassified Corynebacterium TaxID=2624378 RepID=UPI0021696A7D|nr:MULTISPECIES: alpha/beta hydrolase family protein [unclassified Corynebacterium]MCS4489750.1 esterase family protein [Corynebacterium sp. ES2775-CONJ]MCS4491241.1 esterase family protein [Corynebacterium sp. ES2715-CONJ3]MCS4531662.1 esterase family protein [Corynebacterium sp. ES2730-CONJ]MCU9519058.1 esterase family protein [Corynebacterium sp. ES2794-CONJ1]